MKNSAPTSVRLEMCYPTQDIVERMPKSHQRIKSIDIFQQLSVIQGKRMTRSGPGAWLAGPQLSKHRPNMEGPAVDHA